MAVIYLRSETLHLLSISFEILWKYLYHLLPVLSEHYLGSAQDVFVSLRMEPETNFLTLLRQNTYS